MGPQQEEQGMKKKTSKAHSPSGVAEKLAESLLEVGARGGDLTREEFVLLISGLSALVSTTYSSIMQRLDDFE